MPGQQEDGNKMAGTARHHQNVPQFVGGKNTGAKSGLVHHADNGPARVDKASGKQKAQRGNGKRTHQRA